MEHMTDNVDPVDPVNDDDLVTIADKPREPTEYEKRLRREAAKHRTDAKATREELDRFKSASEAEKEAIRVQVQRDADQRVIRAELKTAALKAGMVDLDGLKLLDLSGVKLNEHGEVEGAEALMAKAKETKPYLFAPTGSTSSTSATPPAAPPVPKHAKDMTPEEYRAELAKITGTRR